MLPEDLGEAYRPDDPLYRIVYASAASARFEEEDLVVILNQSCVNNARLGVTGLLLYADGNFIQVLEGPRAHVQYLYARIEQDERHEGVLILIDEPADQRLFPDWSMGFRRLTPGPADELEAFSDEMEHPPDEIAYPDGPVGHLLKRFRGIRGS